MDDGFRSTDGFPKYHQVSTTQLLDQHDTPRKNLYRPRKSWKALYLISSGLILGLALALGNHFFYQNFNGKPVSTAMLSQSWALRIGNIFALLVKLAFAVSIGTAFVQIQWLYMKTNVVTFAEVDAFTGIIGSLSCFKDVSVWKRFPGLALIAMISWLLLFIPIIAPGTLTVVSQNWLNATSLQVPQLQTDHADAWNRLTVLDDSVYDTQATDLLSQLSYATGVQAEILPIYSANMNQTYSLEFVAPAVSCSTVNDTLSKNVSLTVGDQESGGVYVWYAWVGGDTDFLYNNGLDENYPQLLDLSENEPSSQIFIATNTRTNVTEPFSTFLKLNVTVCSLYNASYSVDFSFQNRDQSVTISNITYLNPVSARRDFEDPFLAANGSQPSQRVMQARAYSGLMSAYGELLVGSRKVDLYTAPRSRYTSIDLLDIDYMNIGLAEVQAKFEELFHNMTLSLLSNEAFWQTSDTAAWVPVDVTSFLNTYSYEALDLIIVYAAGLIFTIICSCVGFWAFQKNDASFENKFSTFVRATHTSKARDLIDINDDGANGLTSRLARTPVQFANGSHDLHNLS